MLLKTIMETKEIQINTIAKLLEIGKLLAGTNGESMANVIEENCLLDTAKLNLESSKYINELVSNISDMIQGGKNEVAR